MQQVTVLPIFPERPTNPARTNVRTGEIEINAARMRQLRPDTREYVLLHEVGHYKLQTFDEVAADRYALRRMAGKKPYSLWNYFQSVNEVSYGNPERVNAARRDVLEIAAKNGSKEAQALLDRYAAADGIESSNKTKILAVGMIIILAVIIVPIIIKNIKNGR